MVNNMNNATRYLISGLITTLFASAANAGVVIGGTRVVYEGTKKEGSLSVNNPDSIPYLIQSWIEPPVKDGSKVPFIITPPLYRLDPNEQNVMRIVRAGQLAEDKESMFWLNVKAIPSTEKQENTLQIAVKTRIKLIYRPVKLTGHKPEDFADKLTWSQSGNMLKVSNPTNYYMNFNEISVGNAKLKDVTYVAPGKTQEFPMPAKVNSHKVTYKIINDFGGVSVAHQSSF